MRTETGIDLEPKNLNRVVKALGFAALFHGPMPAQNWLETIQTV